MSVVFERDAGTFLRAVYKKAPDSIDIYEPKQNGIAVVYFTPTNTNGDRLELAVGTKIDRKAVGKLYRAKLEKPVESLLANSVVDRYAVVLAAEDRSLIWAEIEFYPTDETPASLSKFPVSDEQRRYDTRRLVDIARSGAPEWKRREDLIDGMVNAWASALAKEPADQPEASVKK